MQNKTKASDPKEQVFIDYAKKIVHTCRTPHKYLALLNEVNFLYHLFEKDLADKLTEEAPNSSATEVLWLTYQLTNNVVIPWIKDKNNIEEIAKGLNVICNDIDCCDMSKYCGEVYVLIGKDAVENDFPLGKDLEDRFLLMKLLAMMVDLSYGIAHIKTKEVVNA